MIEVGISACLMGQKVRFDGGHKASHFCQHDLGRHVRFVQLCPEVGIGLRTPRPAIRLEGDDPAAARAVMPKTGEDLTAQLSGYADQQQAKLDRLSGYILCAKSPSCGMERVRLYQPGEKHNQRNGVGLFARRLMELYPALPVEEDGRLNDPHLRENFVLRLYVYHDWRQLPEAPRKKQLYDFHARHKLTLLAHNQAVYRQLGKELASQEEFTAEFLTDYIQRLMAALGKPASRADHTNVLQHIQGYFREQLSSTERQELADLILAYRQGTEPLAAPMTLLKFYLRRYPNDYLAQQSYLEPYPDDLKLRYGL